MNLWKEQAREAAISALIATTTLLLCFLIGLGIKLLFFR